PPSHQPAGSLSPRSWDCSGGAHPARRWGAASSPSVRAGRVVLRLSTGGGLLSCGLVGHGEGALEDLCGLRAGDAEAAVDHEERHAVAAQGAELCAVCLDLGCEVVALEHPARSE